MGVMTAIRERRSVRKYTEQPVEKEKLDLVLEAARLSPSASNRQDWKFIVIQDKEMIAKMVGACNNQGFVGQAPVILVACATNPGGIMSCGQPRDSVDLSIATAYMILAAHDLGLGTCWLGSFNEAKVKELLKIPAGIRVVAITPLGYAATKPRPTNRKDIEDITCYEQYS